MTLKNNQEFIVQQDQQFQEDFHLNNPTKIDQNAQYSRDEIKGPMCGETKISRRKIIFILSFVCLILFLQRLSGTSQQKNNTQNQVGLSAQNIETILKNTQEKKQKIKSLLQQIPGKSEPSPKYQRGKSNIGAQSSIQFQNEKEKQKVGVTILQGQTDQDSHLKQPVLTQGHQNDKDPLKSPGVVRPLQSGEQEQQQNSEHLQQNHKTQQFSQSISTKEHKPQRRPQQKQKLQQTQQQKTQQIIINGKKSLKSTQILPIDEVGGFLQSEDIVQIETQVKTDNKDPQNKNNPYIKKDLINKKKTFIAGRIDVKGPNYNFAVPIKQMFNNADLQKIFEKRKSKEGIWKSQFLDAIQKLQITNNVKYGGQIQLDFTKSDSDKYQKIRKINNLISTQTEYLESNYKISQFKKKQLPFCIVVPSYQNVNSGLYLRNLNSIFMQSYSNYHVVYIDDASEDKTGQYVKSYVLSRQIPTQKIEIITNKENRKPPFNIYNAITNHCKLGELAMIVEGDDALLGTNVLNLYNAIYQKDKCSMIYSSYLQIYNNSRVLLGLGHQIMDEYFIKNTIRSIWEIPGKYLLSFYVDIFKSIKVEDFKDPNGYFFWFAYDRALITPLLQVSYPRITIVKEIVYQHRKDSGMQQSLNDWNRQSGQILAKKPYKPLKFFPFIERNKYKYFFDASIDKVVQNSDFQGYTFQNNFEIDGISKQVHIQAIRMTEVIHNVDFYGKIKIQLAQYESSKQEKQSRIQKLLDQDKEYLNEKYNIDQYRNEELPFCILTPSYNNAKSGLFLRNLDSIFMQDYSNYHVVYIDDCSPDKTGEFVKKYLEQRKIPKQKIQLIINKQNKKALSNIHLGIHKYCKSGQIVTIIDGDDSFIGRNILSLFNAVYQRDNSAMAYSNFLTIHNNDRTELGFCHQINKQMFEQNTFRNSWDLPGTHLMTFYSDLFKKIKISDITYPNGTFYDYAYDRAILTPLLEMAYPRISVIKQITYEYRNDTGINDSPNDWIRVSHIILDKKPYEHLLDYPFIKDLLVLKDKFNFKTSIQTIIKNTNLSPYEKQSDKKISGIAKQQHIHAIRLTELVHNIKFNGSVEISLKTTKSPQNKKQRLQKLLKSDKQYLETKYGIQKFKEQELPFCIVVSSYNNVQNGLYLRNLDSILMQDYRNYRVVYIDDNSSDQANEYINDYLQDKKIPTNTLKMIINKQTRKQLANIYFAAHNECKLNEIMLVIGGNDALIGQNVLNVLNTLYQTQVAVVGYGCFLSVFDSLTELGTCDSVDDFYFKTNTFRNRLKLQKYRLMSFYTHLFRRIKVKDMTYENGTFFNNAIDKAIMTPLIEMAYPKILVVKQIMYEYRVDKGSRNAQVQGAQTNKIMGKEPYKQVSDFGI